MSCDGSGLWGHFRHPRRLAMEAIVGHPMDIPLGSLAQRVRASRSARSSRSAWARRCGTAGWRCRSSAVGSSRTSGWLLGWAAVVVLDDAVLDVGDAWIARTCSSVAPIPSVTNTKGCRPASLNRGSRGWWVSTNTGVWNGGSSPHQPFHGRSWRQGPGPPPNRLRPITLQPSTIPPTQRPTLIRREFIDEVEMAVVDGEAATVALAAGRRPTRSASAAARTSRGVLAATAEVCP